MHSVGVLIGHRFQNISCCFSALLCPLEPCKMIRDHTGQPKCNRSEINLGAEVYSNNDMGITSIMIESGLFLRQYRSETKRLATTESKAIDLSTAGVYGVVMTYCAQSIHDYCCRCLLTTRCIDTTLV